MSESNKKILFVSKNWLITVSVYYLLTVVAGIVGATTSILNSNLTGNVTTALIFGGVSMSLIGSGVYYTRKIYKACLSSTLVLSNENDVFLKRLGTLMYLFARPLFGVGFAILIIVGMKAGIVTIVKGSVETSEGFVFLTMFLCFFAGYAAGRVLSRLDDQSDSIAGQVID